VAEKDWLNILVDAISSSEDTAGASGKVYYLDDRDTIYCTWVKINPFNAIPYNFHGQEGTSSIDYLMGCAMVIRRDAIDKVGLIDEGYFLYYEDSDWCARLIRAGFKLMYIPDAIVWHAVSGSVSNSCFKFSYMMRNRIRFILKNFDIRYILIFIMLFPIEMIINLKNDIARKDLRASRIRFNAILWNILNIKSTYNARRRDLSRIVNIRSYNRSLPLRDYKIGFFEKWT
jgi:GT2 family glycosyltransferase